MAGPAPGRRRGGVPTARPAVRVLAARLALCALLALAGCASPRLARESDLPRQVELTRTPFFPQTVHHCGPAALATVLADAGMAASPEDLAPRVYLPARKGSLPLDMLGGARRDGAVAATIRPDLDTLLATVRDGHPVVVLQNLGLSWYPVWHYAVVVGHDLDRREIVLRSGTTRREILSLRTFDLTWARSGRWAMVTIRPGTPPPAGVPRDAYAEATLALERLRLTRAASDAYTAAIARWPDDLQFAIGAGNTAYALGDLAAAESALRTAVARHPSAGAALNNLAHVLMERGALDEAEATAERAVTVGGPQKSTAVATLEEIRTRRATPR
jgi:hypothetical protein